LQYLEGEVLLKKKLRIARTRPETREKRTLSSEKLLIVARGGEDFQVRRLKISWQKEGLRGRKGSNLITITESLQARIEGKESLWGPGEGDCPNCSMCLAPKEKLALGYARGGLETQIKGEHLKKGLERERAQLLQKGGIHSGDAKKGNKMPE